MEPQFCVNVKVTSLQLQTSAVADIFGSVMLWLLRKSSEMKVRT